MFYHGTFQTVQISRKPLQMKTYCGAMDARSIEEACKREQKKLEDKDMQSIF